MEPIWTLSLFSLSMFLGCYIAGSIPLLLSLSEVVLLLLVESPVLFNDPNVEKWLGFE